MAPPCSDQERPALPEVRDERPPSQTRFRRYFRLCLSRIQLPKVFASQMPRSCRVSPQAIPWHLALLSESGQAICSVRRMAYGDDRRLRSIHLKSFLKGSAVSIRGRPSSLQTNRPSVRNGSRRRSWSDIMLDANCLQRSTLNDSFAPPNRSFRPPLGFSKCRRSAQVDAMAMRRPSFQPLA